MDDDNVLHNDLENIKKKLCVQVLAKAGIIGDIKINELECGGNNRVYRLEHSQGNCLLKEYFFHVNDQRDRLGTEYAFSEYAWNQGLRFLPQPLACDYEARLGLYEFVAGKPLAAAELGRQEVQAAIDFILALNRKYAAQAFSLPNASEACFSLQSHLECVAGRIRRLENIKCQSNIDREAASFLQTKIMPFWQQMQTKVRAYCGSDTIFLKKLTKQECFLSPSDFGFHNALRRHNGNVCFFDFEYAGWDDPAKLVCDFFCQVKVPVSEKWLAMFVEALAAESQQAEWFRQRVALLLPVYRLKWCCIVLNEFLPVSFLRRCFAGKAGELELKKEQQLAKAQKILIDLQQEKGK